MPAKLELAGAALLLLVLHTACAAPAQAPAVERLRVEIVAEYPHDPAAFTQGLLWRNGELYESTGLYGESSLRRVEPATGRVLERIDLDPAQFGEGLALADDRLVQLTFQEGTALVYDPDSLVRIREMSYAGDGWGLEYDGARFIQTDGSASLIFRDPATFAVSETIEVTLDGEPVERLNELELVDGRLYANVLNDDRIMRIDPQSGKVTAVIDASGLLSPPEQAEASVLNGIAYRPDSQTFWLTGKRWPKMFEVVFARVE